MTRVNKDLTRRPQAYQHRSPSVRTYRGGPRYVGQHTMPQEAESYAEYEAVHATLQHYIEGARTGSTRLMRLAFLDTAQI